MFVRSVLTLSKNENAEKNPLCVYEDNSNTSKIKILVCIKEPMGILANKCNFFRDSLAEFSKMQRPDSP